MSSPKIIPLKRRNANNPQIKSYVEAVQRGQKSIHILYDKDGGGSWKVKRIGAHGNEGVFSTKDEAFFHAREIARENDTEVIIHGQDGLIRERQSYGQDPYAAKN